MASKVKCKYCGTYLAKSDAFSAGLSSFCDRDHYYSHLNKAKAPKKRAVSNSRPKRANYTSISQVTYDRVLSKDVHRCRLCGSSSNRLALHHVYYKSEAKWFPWCSQAHNLITLCNEPCHLGVVHADKERFQPLLLGLIWLREVENDARLTVYQLEEKLKNDRST